jgi:hypothetical protein
MPLCSQQGFAPVSPDLSLENPASKALPNETNDFSTYADNSTIFILARANKIRQDHICCVGDSNLKPFIMHITYP